MTPLASRFRRHVWHAQLATTAARGSARLDRIELPPRTRFDTMCAPLHALLLACAASFAPSSDAARTAQHAALAPRVVPAEETVLGLLVSGADAPAAHADITLAVADVELAAGDVLVYRVCTPEHPLVRASVELELTDGRRIAAPAPLGEDWRDVKLELWPWAGARVRATHAVFDELQDDATAIYLGDVRIAHAEGASLELVPASAPITAPGELRDGACVRATTSELAPPSAWLPARADDISEPWFAFDLTTLRTRATRAESAAAPLVRADWPSGYVWAGAGIPLRFASSGEPLACSARAQRISLEPLDGGRYYELYLALATISGEAIDSTWQLVGVDGEFRPIHVRIPVRDESGVFAVEPADGFALAGACVLRVPVVSSFSLAALELPDDPRVHVLAATARWRKEAAAAAPFRRAWLARERPSADLRRYLALVHATELATPAHAADGEEAHERELFRLLLARDTASFDTLLAERTRALDARVPDEARALVLFEAVAPGLDHSRSPAELRSAAAELARAVTKAARGAPELHLRAPEGRVLESLSGAEQGELAACARAGALACAPAGWTHGEWGVLGEEACVRQLAWGQRALERVFGHASTLAWAPHDFGYFRQLPQLARAVHCDALLGAPVDWSASNRPLACELSAPNGASVLALTPPRVAGNAREPRLAGSATVRALFDAARTRGGAAVLHVPYTAVELDGTATRTTRRARAAIAEELPLVETRTIAASDLAREFAAPAGTEPVAWRATFDGASARTRAWSDELAAWNRRAEDHLVQAQTAMALASLDGLEPLRRLPQQLWERVLANHEAAANGCADPALRTDAREAAASAEALEREALESLASGVDTSGLGRALFVYNPLSWERSEIVRVEGTDFVVCDTKGRALPAQRTRDGHTLARVTLPSLGYAVVFLVPRALAPPDAAEPEQRVRVDGWRVANDTLAFEIDPATGEVAHVRSLESGRELVERAAVTEFCPAHGDPQSGTLETCELVESGPLRARVRVVRTFGGARVEQELTLTAASTRIDVRTRVTGLGGASLRTTMRLTDVQFAASRTVPFASNRIPSYGSGTERAATLAGVWHTGQSTGAGLCSDSAAACRAAGRELSLWLADPEPDGASAAREIAWAIVPLTGRTRDLAFTCASRELRFPVRSFVTGTHAGARPASFAFLDVTRSSSGSRAIGGAAAGVVLTQFAPADGDGAWIVRLYDAAGTSGRVQLRFGAPISSWERVDPLERPLGEAASSLRTTPQREVVFELAPSTIETLRVRWRP